VLADVSEQDGLKVIDLGAGHSSSNETLCGRVIQALRQEALLNESVGAGYLDRNWPPAHEESGAWPLSSLRQAFVNGSLTRLLDPEKVLRSRIVEFVAKGDFGLASGRNADGTYDRVWFRQNLAPEEVAFDADVFLLKKATAEALQKAASQPPVATVQPPETQATGETPEAEPVTTSTAGEVAGQTIVRLRGSIPPEVWNRFGTKIIPKLRQGEGLSVRVEMTVSVDASLARQLENDIRQIANDIGVACELEVDEGQ